MVGDRDRTYNALGFRAGNAAMDEIAVALEVLYNVRTGLRLEMLPWLSDMVSQITGISANLIPSVPMGYAGPPFGMFVER